MKKVNLLSRTEMKKVMGGVIEEEEVEDENEGGNGGSNSGGTSPKVKACEGKKEGDACSFSYNGGTSTGYCRSYAPNYVKHCSNLL